MQSSSAHIHFGGDWGKSVSFTEKFQSKRFELRA